MRVHSILICTNDAPIPLCLLDLSLSIPCGTRAVPIPAPD